MSRKNGRGNPNLLQNLAWLAAFVGGIVGVVNVFPTLKAIFYEDERVLITRTKLGKESLRLLGSQPKMFISDCLKDESAGVLNTELKVNLDRHASYEYRARHGDDLFEGEILQVINKGDSPVTGLLFKDQTSTVLAKYAGTVRPNESLILLTRLQFLAEEISPNSNAELKVSGIEFVTGHRSFTRELPPAPKATEWSKLPVKNECGEIYSGSWRALDLEERGVRK